MRKSICLLMVLSFMLGLVLTPDIPLESVIVEEEILSYETTIIEDIIGEINETTTINDDIQHEDLDEIIDDPDENETIEKEEVVWSSEVFDVVKFLQLGSNKAGGDMIKSGEHDWYSQRSVAYWAATGVFIVAIPGNNEMYIKSYPSIDSTNPTTLHTEAVAGMTDTDSIISAMKIIDGTLYIVTVETGAPTKYHCFSTPDISAWTYNERTEVTGTVQWPLDIFEINGDVWIQLTSTVGTQAIYFEKWDFSSLITDNSGPTTTTHGIGYVDDDLYYYIYTVLFPGAADIVIRTFNGTTTATDETITEDVGGLSHLSSFIWKQGNNKILFCSATDAVGQTSMLYHYDNSSQSWTKIDETASSGFGCGIWGYSVTLGYRIDYNAMEDTVWKFSQNGAFTSFQTNISGNAMFGLENFIVVDNRGGVGQQLYKELEGLSTKDGVTLEIIYAEVFTAIEKAPLCLMVDATGTDNWDFGDYTILYDDDDNEIFEGYVDDEKIIDGLIDLSFRSPLEDDLDRIVSLQVVTSSIKEIIEYVVDTFCLFMWYDTNITDDGGSYTNSWRFKSIREIFKWCTDQLGYRLYFTSDLEIYFDDGTTDSGKDLSEAAGDTFGLARKGKTTYKVAMVELRGGSVDGERLTSIKHSTKPGSHRLFDNYSEERVQSVLDDKAQELVDKHDVDLLKYAVSDIFDKGLYQYGQQADLDIDRDFTVASAKHFIVTATYEAVSKFGTCVFHDQLFIPYRRNSGATPQNNEQLISGFLRGENDVAGIKVTKPGDHKVFNGISGQDWEIGDTDLSKVFDAEFSGDVASIVDILGHTNVFKMLKTAAGLANGIDISGYSDLNHDLWFAYESTNNRIQIFVNSVAPVTGLNLIINLAGHLNRLAYNDSVGAWIDIGETLIASRMYRLRIEYDISGATDVATIRLDGAIIAKDINFNNNIADAALWRIDMNGVNDAANAAYIDGLAFDENDYESDSNMGDGHIQLKSLNTPSARVGKFDARYNDIPISITVGKLPGANFPSWEAYTVNTNAYAFAVNDFIDLAPAEVLHGYKAGTDLEFHVHFALNAALATGDEKLQFSLYVSWTEVGDIAADSTLTAEAIIPDGSADLQNFLLSLGILSGVGKTFGGITSMRLQRVAKTAGGTELVGDPFGLVVGIHYLKENIGSESTPHIEG